MKRKGIFLAAVFMILTMLTGCEPLAVLDPKGPQDRIQAEVIWTMAFIIAVVIALFIYMVVKYRSANQKKDYKPPYIEGSLVVELLCVGIPIIIVIFLSIVSVKSNYIVEATPQGYEDKEPLVVYASSSDWKWHFSYPEENIETVNYLYIPTDRPLEFKLYTYGPITSFWIPQLGGQKYAMADMVTTLHLAADVPGEYAGRNANFSGRGFAENTFNVKAVTEEEFEEWVDEVKTTANPLTEETFNQLLEPGHVGQSTFTDTHLQLSPAPEGHRNGHSSNNVEPSHSQNTQNNSEQHH